MLKKCSKCKIEKTLDSFYKCKSAKNGLMFSCKICFNIVTNKWRQEHKEYLKEWQRKYSLEYARIARNDPSRKTILAIRSRIWGKRYKFKKKYGITKEDKEVMWIKQIKKCLICNTTIDLLENACLDHNHTTKQIRGILCAHCNKGLGFFRDNPILLQSAKNYLENFLGNKK